MPSKYESLSVVTLEAMAQSTPVLVNGHSKVLYDHIADSAGGMIFTDYKSFSDAMRQIFENHTKLEMMGHAGRKYVTEKYDHQCIKESLIDEIDKG